MTASLGSIVRRFTYRPEFDPETGVNKRLLKRVEDHIRKYPESYDQTVFCFHDPHEPGLDGSDVDTATDIATLRSSPMCGTQACVAGWAVLYAGQLPKRSRTYFLWEREAAKLLGLSDGLASWLFDSDRSAKAMPDILAAIRKGTLDLDSLEALERLVDPNAVSHLYG